ncbi:MAG: hypothetical protein WA824_11090, partial [Candidatus Sulfotelmatobacter sp.]
DLFGLYIQALAKLIRTFYAHVPFSRDVRSHSNLLSVAEFIQASVSNGGDPPKLNVEGPGKEKCSEYQSLGEPGSPANET